MPVASALCPHRVPKDSYCKKCAEGAPAPLVVRSDQLATLPDPETAALALIERGRSAIAEAQTLEDAQSVFAQTKVLQAATEAVKLTRETIVAASAVRVRAERRVGQLLAQTPKATGGLLRGTVAVPREMQGETLADLGVTKKESAQAQRLAALPEEKFEAAVETVQRQAAETGGHVTTGAVLRAADPAAAKRPEERWLEADRFIDRCGQMADDGADVLATVRFGRYPGDQDALVYNSALRQVARLRDTLVAIHEEIERRRP
jgi:hypothetical protein